MIYDGLFIVPTFWYIFMSFTCRSQLRSTISSGQSAFSCSDEMPREQPLFGGPGGAEFWEWNSTIFQWQQWTIRGGCLVLHPTDPKWANPQLGGFTLATSQSKKWGEPTKTRLVGWNSKEHELGWGYLFLCKKKNQHRRMNETIKQGWTRDVLTPVIQQKT